MESPTFEVGRGCLVMVVADDERDTMLEAVLVDVTELDELLRDCTIEVDGEDVSVSDEAVLVLLDVGTVVVADEVDFTVLVFAFVAVPETTVAGAVENVFCPHNQSARSPVNACAMTVSGFTP